MEAVFNWIVDLFVGEGLAIAVGVYIIGVLIKQATPLPNKYIPLIGGVLGVLAAIFAPGMFAGEDWFLASVKGLALGWAATGGYEAIRNVLPAAPATEAQGDIEG